jgi:hypothetical protein
MRSYTWQVHQSRKPAQYSSCRPCWSRVNLLCQTDYQLSPGLSLGLLDKPAIPPDELLPRFKRGDFLLAPDSLAHTDAYLSASAATSARRAGNYCRHSPGESAPTGDAPDPLWSFSRSPLGTRAGPITRWQAPRSVTPPQTLHLSTRPDRDGCLFPTASRSWSKCRL